MVPFGHGLSYTTFSWSGVEADTDELAVDGTVHVGCTVTNAGPVAGEDVVQLYVQQVGTSVVRPALELKGFARVPLAPGATARVAFDVPADVLAFTGLDLRRAVEPGRLDLLLAASATDIRGVVSVDVVGPRRIVGPDRALVTTSTVSPVHQS